MGLLKNILSLLHPIRILQMIIPKHRVTKITSISKQTGLFSKRPLCGYYRYKDFFQILPVIVKNNYSLIDYPLVLEVFYCPDIWPHNKQLLWYRDVWEKERFESIKNKTKKKLETSDGWIQAYEQNTKQLRPRAIFEEISNLLSLFSNHRFFNYNNGHRWVLSHDEEKGTITQHWGQLAYSFSLNSNSREKLSDISEYEVLNKISPSDYRKEKRDAFYVGKSDNNITFPEDIDRLFDLYFQLSHEDMKAFHTACKFYNQALDLKTTHPSLSLVSSAIAIEALMSSKKIERNECGHEKSIETCDVCGIPLHHLYSRFKTFFADYGATSDEVKKFASKFYDFRSGISHGDLLLREDLHDSGFYSGDNDEQAGFRRDSLNITHKLLINWLINHE